MSFNHEVIIEDGISDNGEQIYENDGKISSEEDWEYVSGHTVNDTLQHLFTIYYLKQLWEKTIV